MLLCSSSVVGLQKMIDIATKYIINHGLRFNPSKTFCHIMGPNPYTSMQSSFSLLLCPPEGRDYVSRSVPECSLGSKNISVCSFLIYGCVSKVSITKHG